MAQGSGEGPILPGKGGEPHGAPGAIVPVFALHVHVFYLCLFPVPRRNLSPPPLAPRNL